MPLLFFSRLNFLWPSPQSQAPGVVEPNALATCHVFLPNRGINFGAESPKKNGQGLSPQEVESLWKLQGTPFSIPLDKEFQPHSHERIQYHAPVPESLRMIGAKLGFTLFQQLPKEWLRLTWFRWLSFTRSKVPRQKIAKTYQVNLPDPEFSRLTLKPTSLWTPGPCALARPRTL